MATAVAKRKTERPTDASIKRVVKEVFRESLRENRRYIEKIVLTVFEDLALAKAMRKGRKTPLVPKEEVLRILREKP